MTKRLMQVFVVSAAMAALAGAAEAKTTPRFGADVQPAATGSAQRPARTIFVGQAASSSSKAGFATPMARAGAQSQFGARVRLRSAFDPAQLALMQPSFGAWSSAPAALRAAQAAPSAAKFAPQPPQAATPASPPAQDWGAYDAAYRGGPISTYGADAPVGVGLRIRF